MSVIPIIGQHKRNDAGQIEVRIARQDIGTLEFGATMVYMFQGWPLSIYAHRGGIGLGFQQQMLPALNPGGVMNLVRLLSKCVRQHLHLTSFPPGTPQSMLAEKALDLPEMQGFPAPLGAVVPTACIGKFHAISDEDDTCACGKILRYKDPHDEADHGNQS